MERLWLTDGVVASSASVAALLRERGVEPHAWSNDRGDRYPPHRHAYTKLLMCAAGSITFHFEDADLALHPGEGFVLPPGTSHAATVGPEGVTCLEGHRA